MDADLHDAELFRRRLQYPQPRIRHSKERFANQLDEGRQPTILQHAGTGSSITTEHDRVEGRRFREQNPHRNLGGLGEGGPGLVVPPARIPLL